MSVFRFGNKLPERDDFWSGQAVMETKFSVGNMVAARDTKLNQGKDKITAGVNANAANTGVQVNFLVLMDKTNIIGNGFTPPVVFDSLTGIGYKKTESKWDLMDRLSLVGRAQSTVNYQGTVPEQKDISVQVGGLAGVRIFMPKPGTVVAWGTRLAWTVPDISPGGDAGETYRHLLGLARAEFPKGKVPVLVEPLSEQMHAELPAAAMAHFIKMSSADLSYWNSSSLQSSKHPLERYILTNFVGPAKAVFRAIEVFGINRPKTAQTMYDTILLLNLGLVPSSSLSAIKNRLGLSDSIATKLRNSSQTQMAGQYDCFTWVRDHNFGKSMSVGTSGDGVKVLFRIT